MTTKLTDFLLVFTLLVSGVTPAFAADGTPDPEPRENWTDGPGNATEWDRHGMELDPYLALWSKDADMNRYLGEKRQTLEDYMLDQTSYNASQRNDTLAMYELATRVDLTWNEPPQEHVDKWNKADREAYSLASSDQTSFVPQTIDTRNGAYVAYANGSRTAVIRDAFIHEQAISPMTVVHLATTATGDQRIRRYVANGDRFIENPHASALIDYRVKEPKKTVDQYNESISYTYKNAEIEAYRVADSNDCSFDDTSCDWGRTTKIPENQIPNTSYKINGLSENQQLQVSFDHQAKINVTMTRTVKYCKENKDDDGDGVPNYKDECPNTYGEGSDGCPIDTDGDGIYDKNDKCDTEAKGEGEDGCYIDSDGDGGWNWEDSCDNNAGPASNDYCPKDSDGDGVYDKNDDCPYTYGDGSNGCPTSDTNTTASSTSDSSSSSSDTTCYYCYAISLTPPVDMVLQQATATLSGLGSLLPSVSAANVVDMVSPLFVPMGDLGVLGQVTPSVSQSADAAPSLSCKDGYHIETDENRTGTIHRTMVVTEETTVRVNSLDSFEMVYAKLSNSDDYVMYGESDERWSHVLLNDKYGARTGWAYYTQRRVKYDNLTKKTESGSSKQRGPMQPMVIHALPSSSGPMGHPPRKIETARIINHSRANVNPPNLPENIEIGVAVSKKYSSGNWLIMEFDPLAAQTDRWSSRSGTQMNVYGLVAREVKMRDVKTKRVLNETTLNLTVTNVSSADDTATVRVNLTNNNTGEPIDLQNLTYSYDSDSVSSYASMSTHRPPYIKTNTGEYLYTNSSGVATFTVNTTKYPLGSVNATFVPKPWWTVSEDKPIYRGSSDDIGSGSVVPPDWWIVAEFLLYIAILLVFWKMAGLVFGVSLSPTEAFQKVFGRNK